MALHSISSKDVFHVDEVSEDFAVSLGSLASWSAVAGMAPLKQFFTGHYGGVEIDSPSTSATGGASCQLGRPNTVNVIAIGGWLSAESSVKLSNTYWGVRASVRNGYFEVRTTEVNTQQGPMVCVPATGACFWVSMFLTPEVGLSRKVTTIVTYHLSGTNNDVTLTRNVTKTASDGAISTFTLEMERSLANLVYLEGLRIRVVHSTYGAWEAAHFP